MTVDLTPLCGHGHLTNAEVRHGVRRPICTRRATQYTTRPGQPRPNWFCDEHATYDVSAQPDSGPHDPTDNGPQ